jgi:transcriptional regulator with XRE-family HTH domain
LTVRANPGRQIGVALIGSEIRRLRLAMGMTLHEFGRHVGLPWQTLYAYEEGRSVPPADRFLLIVHATRRVKEPFRVERVARAVARAAA